MKNGGNRQKWKPNKFPIQGRSMHGSIQNQKEAKLPNSHKVTFFNQNSSSLHIIFVIYLNELIT